MLMRVVPEVWRGRRKRGWVGTWGGGGKPVHEGKYSEAGVCLVCVCCLLCIVTGGACTDPRRTGDRAAQIPDGRTDQ